MGVPMKAAAFGRVDGRNAGAEVCCKGHRGDDVAE